MNKEGKGLSKPILIVFGILVVGLVGVFFILNLTKKSTTKPLTNDDYIDTTTTTMEVVTSVNSQGETVTVPANEEKIVATNFSASLENIIYGNSFEDDYHVSIFYSGVKFSFNCTNYDEFTKVCKEGNAQMNSGTALLPLYTYTSEDDNYLNNPKDYYIILNDKYIILVNSKTGVKSGEIKVYSRTGNYINTISNTITGFRDLGEIDYGYYPNIDGEEIYYYTCSNNNVVSESRNLNDLNTVTSSEILEGATCN